MKKYNSTIMVSASIGMLLLILDGKTAILGAREGAALCIQTLIPSLFPFFIFSILLTGSIIGKKLPLLRPIGRLCRISPGCESLLAIGFLGGYPVGAQNVALAYHSGQLSKTSAQRMLPFCSNAGPAFLFGILGPMFSSRSTVWTLWGIHIMSALLTGAVLPGQAEDTDVSIETAEITVSHALDRAVRVMASVCGWVIMFRILLQFMDRWIFWFIPEPVQVFISGIIELSNGCVSLTMIPDENERFLMASILLALGGLCVTMQTVSLCDGLSMKMYFTGKLLQSCFAAILALLVKYPLLNKPMICPVAVICFVCIILILLRTKKEVAF